MGVYPGAVAVLSVCMRWVQCSTQPPTDPSHAFHRSRRERKVRGPVADDSADLHPYEFLVDGGLSSLLPHHWPSLPARVAVPAACWSTGKRDWRETLGDLGGASQTIFPTKSWQVRQHWLTG